MRVVQYHVGLSRREAMQIEDGKTLILLFVYLKVLIDLDWRVIHFKVSSSILLPVRIPPKTFSCPGLHYQNPYLHSLLPHIPFTIPYPISPSPILSTPPPPYTLSWPHSPFLHTIHPSTNPILSTAAAPSSKK